MRRDPRHSACRRMLEDVTSERDKLSVERDHWRERFEDLDARFAKGIADIERANADIIEMQRAHIESLERDCDRRQEAIDGYVVELAMVREGLTP